MVKRVLIPQTKPSSYKPEKNQALNNYIREQQVVAELQKRLFLQRAKDNLEAKNLKQQIEEDYAAGRAAEEIGWWKEIVIVARRHVEETEKQEEINKALEQKVEKAVLDLKAKRSKVDKEKSKGIFWKTKCSEKENLVTQLRVAIGKTATALAESAATLKNVDAAHEAAIDAIYAATESIDDNAKSMSVAFSAYQKAKEVRDKTGAIIDAADAAAEAAAAEAYAARAAEAAAAEAAAAEAAAAEVAAAEAAAAETARIEAFAAEITAAIVAEATAKVARAHSAKTTGAKKVIFIF